MRHADKQTLLATSRQLRQHVLDCLEHIDQSREQVPHLEILNPPLWELGHIGWFHEFWCLRDGDFTQASTLPGADDLFNSTDVIHARRWTLPLHSMQATRAYLSRVFDLAAERLDQCDGSEQAMYFHRLSHFHEAMHLEAFCYSWQTVGYPRPSMLAPIPLLKSKAVDIEIAACSVRLGSDPSDGFCFDNEKWGLDCAIEAFRIADQPVTNREFADFVRDGGYTNPHIWDELFWRRLQAQGRTLPLYWIEHGSGFMKRHFDQISDLEPDAPMLNLSAFEAEAYCRWADRRLPTETQWIAAAADPRCQWGGLGWEWTASRFEPLPGFSPDPYKEYSEPWFYTHRVVRGGSFATPPQLTDIRFRNFYQPWRADPFFGFRTCPVS